MHATKKASENCYTYIPNTRIIYYIVYIRHEDWYIIIGYIILYKIRGKFWRQKDGENCIQLGIVQEYIKQDVEYYYVHLSFRFGHGLDN